MAYQHGVDLLTRVDQLHDLVHLVSICDHSPDAAVLFDEGTRGGTLILQA